MLQVYWTLPGLRVWDASGQMQMNLTTMIVLIKLWQDAGKSIFININICWYFTTIHTVAGKGIVYVVVKLIILHKRELFGPEGRLVEIMSDEDQALALKVIIEAEASFTLNDPEYSYWVTGLRDLDDDYVWTWAGSRADENLEDIFEMWNVQVVEMQSTPTGIPQQFGMWMVRTVCSCCLGQLWMVSGWLLIASTTTSTHMLYVNSCK